LALKKITIVLVPEGTNRVRQFRFPRFLPLVFILLFISCAVLLSWLIQDYRAIKVQVPRLAYLEKERKRQKKQFVHLADRIDQISKKMGDLKEFDRKLRGMVNLETGEDKTEFRGIGGSDPSFIEPGNTMARTHRELAALMYRSLDNLEDEIALGKQDKTELHKFLENQKILLASTPSIWPTKGWLSSRFGYRTSPFTGKKEFHKGIDVSTRMGAPVVAVADGIVSAVGRDHGYGRVLSLKHGYGLVTRYAHLKKALVKKGQYVKRGETIALVGNSGRSTGPHLHYEVHLNRVAVNPLRYIPN
jgi:murein DD-endopeptidase MepM/ murein hydrolase activator NlpD